jgi:hypothetical protein
VAAIVGLGLCAAPARADWNGDYHGDVLATNSAGALLMYRGDGAGGWLTGSGEPIGSGWTFPKLIYPGDFSGDGNPDLLAIDADARLLMYRGNGAGGWVTGSGEPIGSGWSFPTVFSPGDFSGDGKPDLLAIDSDGRMLMYRGNGAGGWITGSAEVIGGGWGGFTAVFAGGDFSGDGKPDVLARQSDGTLLMYRGDGAGSWVVGYGEPVGSGWQNFDALVGGGDFDGDGRADVLARLPDGKLLLYHGNGAGSWTKGFGDPIGAGFESLGNLTLVPGQIPPPPPPSPPAAPVPGGSVQVKAGKHCTLSGQRMRVTLKVKRVRGRAAPRVVMVSFFVRKGAKIVDHHRPYVVHLRMRQAPGTRGRVYARVYFRRAGSRELKHKLVSRRFRICG